MMSKDERSSRTQSISACIISYNEEHNIVDCLDSVSWCDEIVVVDSFSKDRTVELARDFGARVIQEKWAGHIAQKNKALEAAQCDWILSLDCDERVTRKLKEKTINLLESGPKADGYYISRKLNYMGSWLEHGGWFPEWRLRLIRRGLGHWDGVDPHDKLHLSGTAARVDPGGRGVEAAVILHYSFQDLSHQLRVLDRYSEIHAGELYSQGRRAGWADLTIRPLWRFVWTYLLRGGFLDGAAGTHMSLNHAYAAYMKYARLWELQNGLVAPRPKDLVVPVEEERGGENQKAVAS